MSMRMLAIVVCFAVSIPPVLGAVGRHESTCAPNGCGEGTSSVTSMLQKKTVVKDHALKTLDEEQTWESSGVSLKTSLHRLQDNIRSLGKDCQRMGETAENTCNSYEAAASHSRLGSFHSTTISEVRGYSSAFLSACQALESSGSMLQTDGNMEASVLSVAEAATTFASFEKEQERDASRVAESLGKFASALNSSVCNLAIGSTACSQTKDFAHSVERRMVAWAAESHEFANGASTLEVNIKTSLLDQSVKASSLAQTNSTHRRAALLEGHVVRLADLVGEGVHADESLSKDLSQLCGSIASQIENVSSLRPWGTAMVQMVAGTLTSAMGTSLRVCETGLTNVLSN